MSRRLPNLDNDARSLGKKTCRSFVTAIACTLFLCATALAQEATQTAPWAYKLQFENEWVRVIRVHYEPREKLPPHAHTKWPCAYIYLNDSGPVIFRHKDWDHPELTRPATKAGSFRLSPTSAVNEIHEVENPNDTPSDFLRVEFKTVPIGRQSLRGRFHREAQAGGENFRKVQFENEQRRVTRLVYAPRQILNVAANASAPALFVSLSATQLNINDSAKPITIAPGQTVWLASGQQERWENRSNEHLELLRFDLKTPPLKSKATPAKSGR
jgi:predicted metal-dependent enzyme (double-stranded beta helix superfamily)